MDHIETVKLIHYRVVYTENSYENWRNRNRTGGFVCRSSEKLPFSGKPIASGNIASNEIV